MENLELINIAKNDINNFLDKNNNWIVIIWWATATWKTWLSVNLSKHFDLSVISADSRQIYRYMDIWTDKISKQIRSQIPHYQIDIVDPDQIYTAWNWKLDTQNYINSILKNWKIPFVVGGTWLYIDTIFRNFTMSHVSPDYDYRNNLELQEAEKPWYLHNKLKQVDPEQSLIIHPNSTRHIIRALEIYDKTWKTKSELAQEQPVQWPMLMIGLWREKDDTNTKINKRIKEMFEQWLVQEVDSLMKMWYSVHLPAMLGIWYKEVVWYLNWEYDLEKTAEILRRNTHQYAKRQRTWFRRYITWSKAKPKKDVEHKLYLLD